MVDLGALLSIPCVEAEIGFDISPDGIRAAFSWNPDGRWEIYETLLTTDADPIQACDKTPHLLSSGPGGKFHPRYSNDGRKLAYLVDFNGSEKFHIILQDLATRQETDLTPDTTSTIQASFAWSPDGEEIAFISDQSGRFDVYILYVKNKESRLILDAGFPAWKVGWSPDGKWLDVVVEASGIDYGTYVVPAQGGSAVRIAEKAGPIDAGQACWSPNSQYLAFSSDSKGNNNIGIYDITMQQVTWLTEGDRENQFPAWSPDGSLLTYVVNCGAVSWLAVQKPGEIQKVYQLEPGEHYLPRFSPDGKHLIFAFDNPRHPVDLWELALADEKFTQLTDSLQGELAGAAFVLPEEVTYPGMDGTPVPALLYRSSEQKPGPAVVVIHGGPDWFFEMTWYPIMIHMASRGWVVLAPNYRGSTGYGRAWQEASRFDFGGVDTDDVAAGALYLAQAGLADPTQIAVTGRSHGGYLTASCLTRYPDLWAAGSAFVPFLNWFTNHNEIRPDLQQWDLENFGDPVHDHALYQERSPSFYLDRICAPLQLICGRHDARCPLSDSIEAHAELLRLGKEVELIIYEDEGHAFLKSKNVLDSELRRIAFLAKYLET